MSRSVYEFSGKIRYSDFADAATDFCHAVSARHGLPGSQIVVTMGGGPTASVRFDKHGGLHGALIVSLPTIDPETRITATLARKTLAYLVHEVLHILHTLLDPGHISRAYALAAQNVGVPRGDLTSKKGGFPGFFNAVEDYYIERTGTDPAKPVCGNAGDLLGGLNETLFADHVPAMATVRWDDPQTILQVASNYLCMRCNRHGRMTTPRLDAGQATLDSAVPAEVRKVLDHLMDQLDGMSDRAPKPGGRPATQRLTWAAEAMLALRGQGEGEGQGEGHGQGEGEGQGEGQGQGQGQGEGETGNATPPDLSEARDDALADATAGDALDPRTPQGRTVAEMQPGAAQAAKGAGGLEVPAAHRHPTQSQNAVNQMQAIRAQLHTRKVETAARRGLRSVEKITHDRRLQTGRLDRRAVSRIALGAPDVMARRTTTPGLRTAVALMLDASGSMSSNVQLGNVVAPRFVASLAVLSVLAPAMRRAGAEVAVYGFTATGGFVTSPGKDPHGGLVGVMSGASVFPLLGWHERAPTEALVQRWSTLHAPGGTPMAREAEYVTRALLSRRTERRAAVWLCDGEANDPDQAARVIASANRRGVEHAGIGIGGDITPSSLEALFGPDRWRHVPDDLGQLPDAIEAVLLGGGK